MKLLLETTDWGKHGVPNHIYIFDGSSRFMVGFIPRNTWKAIKFKGKQSFDQKHRTFQQLTAKEAKVFDLSELKQ